MTGLHPVSQSGPELRSSETAAIARRVAPHHDPTRPATDEVVLPVPPALDGDFEKSPESERSAHGAGEATHERSRGREVATGVRFGKARSSDHAAYQPSFLSRQLEFGLAAVRSCGDVLFGDTAVVTVGDAMGPQARCRGSALGERGRIGWGGVGT